MDLNGSMGQVEEAVREEKEEAMTRIHLKDSGDVKSNPRPPISEINFR